MESGVEKAELLGILEVEGLTPENLAKIERWQNKKMAQMEVEGKSDEERFRLDLEMADLYEAANEYQAALDCLGAIVKSVFQQRLEDIYHEINDRMDDLESRTGLKGKVPEY